MMTRFVMLLGVTASIAGCSKKSEPPPSTSAVDPASPATPVERPASAGWYRAVLGEKQGTEIPFFFQLPATGDEAIIATGPDRVRAKLVSRPPTLAVEFPIVHTRIEATAQPSGVLEGTWSSTSETWGASSLSFRAEPIASPEPALRFRSAPGGPAPAGVWKLALPDQTAKLVVAQGTAGELTATLAFPSGNLAFLAGTQDGRTIRLSAFDGASPYLLVAELDEAGATLAGTWTAGPALAWKEALSGTRSPEFELERQPRLARARPTLGVAQLAQAPYAGKPVIVELGGSWCPACGHPVPVLRALREKHAANGLEVLTLLYEFTDDAAYNRTQAERFKATYEIPWSVVPVDGELERYAELMPEGLASIDPSGFPIAVFVARDGTIAGFHAGFPRDPWGEVHAKAVAEYERLAALIAAPAR